MADEQKNHGAVDLRALINKRFGHGTDSDETPSSESGRPETGNPRPARPSSAKADRNVLAPDCLN